MAKLPVIAGFGGINPAGRVSGHHAYRRLVIDALSDELGRNTWASLAALTGQLRKEDGQWHNSWGELIDFDNALAALTPSLEQSTLIRKLETNLFDPSQLLFHRRASIPGSESDPLQFEIRKKHLPSPLPPGWTVSEASSDPKHKLRITATDNFDVLLRSYRQAPVTSAGQLPSNFDPALLYPSRNHPRALQLTVYGASDAINSLGIDWEIIRQKVPADQFSVYASNCMGQLDYNGFGGLLQARLLGKLPRNNCRLALPKCPPIF